MFQVAHYIKGIAKNIFNSRISLFSIVSADSIIDKTAYIYRGVKVNMCTIGVHTYVAANTELENAVVGNYCSIADHCRIGMSGHSLSCLSTSPLFTIARNALQEQWTAEDIFANQEKEETAYIGNDVWIGSHALIKGGVHVGNGACIAAGAVVVKDVPPYAIVGGVPAKLIRYRFSEDVVAKLEELKWWDLPESIIKKLIDYFQKEGITVEHLNEIRDIIAHESCIGGKYTT